MSTTKPPTLTPEMLLFEVACLCSRHGIPVTANNPGAAVYHAEGMLQALGVAAPPPALAAAPEPATATAPLPRFERGRATIGGSHRLLRLAPEGGEHA